MNQKFSAIINLGRCATMLVVAMAATPLLAATRPVSVGVNANWAQQLARSAHIGWSRIDVVWGDVNPADGVWHFSVMDSQINHAVSKGQKILGVLHYAPSWLTPAGNRPPLSTTEWATFVRKVAQRYHGKIQAYEIWNEPDLKSSSNPGIGWTRSIEEPPLYVDFVHAAAAQIRAHAPGALVVAPAYLSNNTASGSTNRKKRILQQICAASYPDGAGPSFVDVVSVHNNASGNEGSKTMGDRLVDRNLVYLDGYCPALRNRPIWVTEYGWRSDAVGEYMQRVKICNLTKIYTGKLEPSTGIFQYNVRRGFIFVQKRDSTSASIFRPNSSPKPVVTQYLQKLSYPAIQQPALSGEFPACEGNLAVSGPESFEEPSEAAIAGVLAEFGLEDPRSSVSSEFTRAYAYVSDEPSGVGFRFEDGNGGHISIDVDVAGRGGEAGDTAFLTHTGAVWTAGRAGISIAGSIKGEPLGKAIVRSIATAMDPFFDEVCKEETFYGDEISLAEFGIRAPAEPLGFSLDEQVVEVTRHSGDCSESDTTDPINLEVTWTFADGTGTILRAGAYKLVADSSPARSTLSSRHWPGADGTRYWVGAWGAIKGSRLDTLLDDVARSMGGPFPL